MGFGPPRHDGRQVGVGGRARACVGVWVNEWRDGWVGGVLRVGEEGLCSLMFECVCVLMLCPS